MLTEHSTEGCAAQLQDSSSLAAPRYTCPCRRKLPSSTEEAPSTNDCKDNDDPFHRWLRYKEDRLFGGGNASGWERWAKDDPKAVGIIEALLRKKDK